MGTLGIGVVTRNRVSVLRTCLEQLLTNTRASFRLVVADDGSEDGTSAWIRSVRIPFVAGPRKGCAWNKNRALFFLLERTECDPILLLEDDTWPTAAGWDQLWIEAVLRWDHVNYCYGFDARDLPPGEGTPGNPYQCLAFGGACTISTRRALRRVGYLNTRFKGYGWEHVEWSHRFRTHYDHVWRLRENALPCLDCGVRAHWPSSSFNRQEFDLNGGVYAQIRANPLESLHRLPWRRAEERSVLFQEISSASRSNGSGTVSKNSEVLGRISTSPPVGN